MSVLGSHFEQVVAAGEGLSLRPLAVGDLPAIEALLAEPDIARWAHFQPGEIAETLNEPGVWPFAVVHNGAVTGYLQVYHANADDFWREFGVPRETVGFDIVLGTRGQGIGPRVVAAMIAHAFAHPAVAQVQVDPDPQNMRAVSAFVRSGLQPQGFFPGYDPGDMMIHMAIDRPR